MATTTAEIRTASTLDRTTLATGDLFPVMDVSGSGASSVAAVPAGSLLDFGSNGPVVRGYASFAAALAAATNVLYVDSATTVTIDTTIPATTSLIFRPGALITVSSGKTLTVLGPVECPSVRVFAGAGTVTFVGNDLIGPVNPVWFGVLGNTTPYLTPTGSASQAVITGLATTTGLSVGQPVVVRSGGGRLSVDPCETGWTSSDATCTITQDSTSTNFFSGTASTKIVFTSSYVVATEMASKTLAASVDLSGYSEVRLDMKYAAGTNGSTFQGSECLYLILKNQAGTVLSRTAIRGGLNAGQWAAGFAPLDKTADLTAVKIVAVAYDALFSSNGSNPKREKYSSGSGATVQTGVGGSLWIDDLRASKDLLTTVLSVDSSTQITLAANLVSAVPSDVVVGSSNKPTGYDAVYCDDQPALQAALTATPDFGSLRWPVGINATLGSTFTIASRQGIRLVGESGQGSSVNQTTGQSGFYWIGDSGSRAIFFNRSRGFHMSGLSLICYATSAWKGLDFDQSGAGSSITSDCVVENLNISHLFNAPYFRGISLSQLSPTNVEFMKFHRCNVTPAQSNYGWGYSFEVGPSFNAKTASFIDCQTTNSERGVNCQLGSFVADRMSGTFNRTDFYVSGSTEPVLILQANMEYSGQPIYCNAGEALRAEGCRWGSVTQDDGSSGYIYLAGTSKQIELLHNKFVAAGGVPANSQRVVDAASSGGTLLSIGNTYLNVSLANSNFHKSLRTESLHDIFSAGGVGGRFTFNGKQYGLYDTTSTGAGLSATVAKHTVGLGSSGRTSGVGDIVSLDEDAIGTMIGGPLELRGGGVMLKKQTITSDTDFSSGGTVSVQSAGLVLVDATSGNITITLPDPGGYNTAGTTTPIWWFKRKDATTNTVRIKTRSGQAIQGYDGTYVYLPVQEAEYALYSDGASKYWSMGRMPGFDYRDYGFPFALTFDLGTGNVTTGTGKTAKATAPFAGYLTKAFISSVTGPVGAALICDVNINGTSVWASTQANRIQIASGQTVGTQTSFDTTAFSEGDLLTIDVDQIGSGTAGAGINVVLRGKRRNY